MKLIATFQDLLRTLLRRTKFVVAGLLPLLLAGGPLTASAQASETIKPGDNLVVLGIPPVPASLAREVQPYMGIYGLPLAGWDSVKREVLLKGLSSVTWISNIEAPGASPKITTYIQANGIYDVYY